MFECVSFFAGIACTEQKLAPLAEEGEADRFRRALFKAQAAMLVVERISISFLCCVFLCRLFCLRFGVFFFYVVLLSKGKNATSCI